MKTLEPDLGRRQLLTFGAAVVFGKVLSSCAATTSSAASSDETADAGSDSTTGTGAATETSAGDAASSDVADAGFDASEVPWATGGTASMTGKASYPNPFIDTPTTCAVTCELTQGPCYSSQSVEIQDISYGYAGLPMRLYLRILDESCKPISGAVVDVWHVGPTGKYSGDDAANEQVGFCTGNDSDFTSHIYFRGKQTSDANGIVTFDSCFPGWYSSRTIHIHMTISVGGQAYLTTQFGFADTLDDEITTTQPLYKDRGKRDTTNATDTVLPATGLADYLFGTQKTSDGAMLASKTLILRSSLGEATCSPAGAGGGPGGGGPGGPPPDGGFPPDGAPPPPP